ncbi:MAG: TonB-dependent receptor [Gammaproteobacteria bacterium]|nr:TonB-dependent receptor [Gammaproteobacteria bacterium]
MKNKSLLILPLLFLTFSTEANTDSKLEHFLSLSLEELVDLETTIATQSKSTLTKTPAVVTIITADDIKATGATNLVDVLEAVPGIHVRANHFAFRPLIHFRGASANQTLLMVDGNPMKDLMWGFGIFWKGLPSSIIERVEIIRGPGSALFGADASAGVINVITKTAGKIVNTEAGLRVGSFNTKSAWIQSGGDYKGYQVNLTAEVFSSDGHNPYIPTDAQTTTDLANATNVSYAPASARYGWRNEDIRFSIIKDKWRLNTSYLRHSELEIGMTGAGVLDPATRGEDSRLNIDLLYSNANFSDNWKMNMAFRYQNLDYTSGSGFQERPPGYDDGSGVYTNGLINIMKSAERWLQFGVNGHYSGFNDHLIHLGTGYTTQDLYSVEQYVNYGTGPDGNPLPVNGPLVDLSGSPYAFAPETIRKISYLFIQDEWEINDTLQLTAGARFDHYSDFGNTVNPRLALVWKNSDKLITKLMYGQAFRAPSYQELYAITSFAKGNTNLKPERSDTLDLSFNYRVSKDLLFTTNLFTFTQRDLIRAVGTPITYQNTGNHTINGIEFEASWQATQNIRFSGNFTLRSQDDSQYRAFDEPEQEAYLRMDWGFRNKWNWNIQANWVGERERKTTDTRPPVNDYLLTDTTLRYIGSKNWEFTASIRNLFNIEATEYTGASIENDLPLPERNFYAEMVYKF